MPADQDLAATANPASRRWALVRRWLPVVVLAVVVVAVLMSPWRSALSLETLVRHRMAINDFISAHQVAGLAIFMLIYVCAVSLSLPGALFLTMTGGVLFGPFVGTAATVVSATIGASIIFKIAQGAFGKTLLRRGGPRVAKIAEGIQADAFHYLLFLRLVPAFPFFLVNLAAALVAVPLPTFIASTFVGIIPATFAFSLAGAGLDSVIAAQSAAFQACMAAGRTDCRIDFNPMQVLTPQLVAALVALGVIALIPVVVKRLRTRRHAPVPPPHS